ncbi:MAG: MarR family winged helix-turn-helix transcriptional regulator [Acidimicrobiales bacterium]
MTDAAEQQVPIARLLAMAYRMQMDGLHDRLRAAGWTDVRPAFGFVLLAARDRPTTGTDLAELMGTSKQAASKLVDAMEAAGFVTRTTSTVDGRQKAVELAPRGRKLLGVVEGIYRDLEAEWAAVVGDQAVERLRHDLVAVLAHAHEGRLPPVRPTW